LKNIDGGMGLTRTWAGRGPAPRGRKITFKANFLLHAWRETDGREKCTKVMKSDEKGNEAAQGKMRNKAQSIGNIDRGRGWLGLGRSGTCPTGGEKLRSKPIFFSIMTKTSIGTLRLWHSYQK
jgi:hypothetical protein